MENEIELECELSWDDGIKRDEAHTQNMQHLYEAKKMVKAIQKKRETTTIAIPGGLIQTTCPEKWKEHNKPYLRGNATREVKS